MASADVLQSTVKLPVELLYIIVSHVAIDYLDDLIAGPRALPAAGIETMTDEQLIGQNGNIPAHVLHIPLPVNVNDNHDEEGNAADGNAGQDNAGQGEGPVLCLHADEELEKGNPLIALLQSGVQIRATMLKVLSDILGIKIVHEGMQRYVIHQVQGLEC